MGCVQKRIFHGKAAHSSTPQLGENAILKMAASLTSPKPAFAEFLCRFFPEGQYESLLSIKRADMVIPFMSEKALVLYLLMKIRNGLRV